MAKINNVLTIDILSVCIANASELSDKKRSTFEFFAAPEEMHVLQANLKEML